MRLTQLDFGHWTGSGGSCSASSRSAGSAPQPIAGIFYVESLGDARHFMTATRALARTKPIVAYKVGRYAELAKAAASHTGAMAGEDAVYQAAFDRAGIARVFEIGDEAFHRTVLREFVRLERKRSAAGVLTGVDGGA